MGRGADVIKIKLLRQFWDRFKGFVSAWSQTVPFLVDWRYRVNTVLPYSLPLMLRYCGAGDDRRAVGKMTVESDNIPEYGPRSL